MFGKSLNKIILWYVVPDCFAQPALRLQSLNFNAAIFTHGEGGHSWNQSMTGAKLTWLGLCLEKIPSSAKLSVTFLPTQHNETNGTVTCFHCVTRCCTPTSFESEDFTIWNETSLDASQAWCKSRELQYKAACFMQIEAWENTTPVQNLYIHVFACLV